MRYAPDEPDALVGLGTALLDEGREARGVSLLDWALEVARLRGEPEPPIVLALARALAERLDDLPTAIAHVSSVQASAAEALTARGLEGRWRALLGDLAGAALAFARLRDAASSLASFRDGTLALGVVAWLIEAATLERDWRGDPLAAQRHLAAALRLLPHHAEARRAYRDVGALLLRAAGGATLEGPGDEPPAPPELEAISERAPAMDLALAEDLGADDEDVVRAARVDELTRRLRDAPANDSVADELASLLEDLGRGHELVALIAGRLEDASPEKRSQLAADARAIFERMAARADVAGHPADASLYRDALEALPS